MYIEEFFECLHRALECFVRWLAELLDQLACVAVTKHVANHVEAVTRRRRVDLLLLFSLRAAHGLTFKRDIRRADFDVHHRCKQRVHRIGQIFHLNDGAAEHLVVHRGIAVGARQREAAVVLRHELAELAQMFHWFCCE